MVTVRLRRSAAADSRQVVHGLLPAEVKFPVPAGRLTRITGQRVQTTFTRPAGTRPLWGVVAGRERPAYHQMSPKGRRKLA
jgi:hypothetical protein